MPYEFNGTFKTTTVVNEGNINDRIYIGMKGLNRTLRILDILISVFYIIGAIIYLEFIELNFCNLNFYTRRNIKERANIEYNIGEISSIDSEYSS